MLEAKRAAARLEIIHICIKISDMMKIKVYLSLEIVMKLSFVSGFV